MASNLARLAPVLFRTAGRTTAFKIWPGSCAGVPIVATGIRGHKKFLVPVLQTFKKRKDQEALPPPPRSAFIEWNYDAELYSFGVRLQEKFDKKFLQQAFVDSSYIAQEEKKQREIGIENPVLGFVDNKELALRGCEIITEYSKAYLRAALPYFPEEGIEATTSFLTSTETMADVAFHLGSKDLIYCSEYPPPLEVLARTGEALVAVVELSSGLEAAQKFTQDFVVTKLVGKDINELWDIPDPMGLLVDILQRENRPLPEPRLMVESGKNTVLAAYIVGLYSDKKLIGKGPGETVDIAQDMAARDALKQLFKTTDNMLPLPFGKQAANLKITLGKNNVSVKDWTNEKIKNIIQC